MLNEAGVVFLLSTCLSVCLSLGAKKKRKITHGKLLVTRVVSLEISGGKF